MLRRLDEFTLLIDFRRFLNSGPLLLYEYLPALLSAISLKEPLLNEVKKKKLNKRRELD